MTHMTWSSLSANPPSFHVFRRDDVVVRTLQGSQVAVHEYRMAYDSLLEASRRERSELERDKLQLEEELRTLTIAKAETDRLLKDQILGLHAGLRASEQAFSELDAEHQRLQQASETITNELLDRVDALHKTVEALQAESHALQSELIAVQADAALKDAAMQQVADLQGAIAALRHRAKHLVSNLEHDKTAAERRVAELSSDLAATQQQLAREAAARVSLDGTAARLAWERQQLAAALELERLINEPLRHSNYATTTTLSYMMRSPVAPTVKNRASPERRPNHLLHPQQQPPQQQHTHQPLATPHAPEPIRTGRPGSAPPAAAAAASTRTTPRDVGPGGSSVTFSPHPLARGAASPGFITGRQLTRLGRSWATTTAAAGPPNPFFLDNLHSPISPPPPGPPRKPVPLVTPSYTPRPGSARSGGGGGGGGSVASTGSITGSFCAGSASAVATAGGGGGTGHRYMPPQYLTAMLRSPLTPYVHDSTAGLSGAATPTEEQFSPTFLRAAPRAPTTATSGAAPAVGGTSPSPIRTGRPVMRAAVKEAWPGADSSPVVVTLSGTPTTVVYG